MSPERVRLTTGFLHEGFRGLSFFGGHLHLSSASWGTGCGAVAWEKPSTAFRDGVKPGAGELEREPMPVKTVAGRGAATRAPRGEARAVERDSRGAGARARASIA